MIRITDQYFWNFAFSVFFVVLVVMATIIIDTESYKDPMSLTVFDFVLMTLATFRLTRLFVYDAVTKWFREQFWDAKKVRGGYVLEKPKGGPRRTLADLLSCPWCFGVWMAAVVTFFYLTSPWAYFLVLFLAIAGVATFMQLTANLIGHKAEQAKRETGL